jgi:P-type Cu2+ transporter
MEQSTLLSGSEAEQASAQVTIALDVTGMRCAGCVQTVEKRLLQQAGVFTAAVNLVTQTAMVEGESGIITPQHLADTLTQLGFPSQVRFQSGDQSLNQFEQADPQVEKSDYGLAIALLLLVFSAVGHLEQMGGLALPVLSTLWFHAGLATVALLGPGRPILREGWQGLRHNAPNMSTLISLGAGCAYLTSLVALFVPSLGWECFFDEPVMIIGFILLGRSLEARARSQTGASLRALLSLQPTVARWLKTVESAQTVTIPVQQVKVGDWLQVLPGDQFPVDGRLKLGQTLVDESMLTGEAMPIAKAAGDLVMAGTLNQSGAVILEATGTGAETALAQIIALVEAAQMRKAPIQRLADTVASYFTYGVLAIATLTFLFWYFLGSRLPLPALHTGMEHGQVRMAEMTVSPLLLSLKLAIAVLVIACPCALGLATPTAILVGTSLGAERGLLIRGGDVLERVQQLDTVVFDKTGTLTLGQPVVQDYWLAEGWLRQDLLQAAASVEQGVRHPLADAITQAAQGLSLPPTSDYRTEPGQGAVAQVAETTVCLGSSDWLQQQGIAIADAALEWGQTLTTTGSSLVYVATAGACVGAIALTDQLRPDAAKTVAELQRLGLTVMVLTGDQAVAAQAVLEPLDLPTELILANVRPAAKAAAIAQLQAAGRQVAMIGDGINDAPALAQANVGIGLASGTDVAIEAAQIVLMRGSNQETRLTDVAAAIRLSRQTFRKIQQNLFWACAYNLIGIPVAAGVLLPSFGIILSPAIAGGMMALSSVCVVTNSLLLRRVDSGFRAFD